jgi:hypothetical protein
MNKAREIFETRVEEINIYFDFLFTVVDRKALLSVTLPFGQGSPNERELLPIRSSLIDTLKANGFLLLYNLVEASVRHALHAIRDHMNENGHHFDDLHDKLQHHFASLMRDDDMRGRITKLREATRPPLAEAIINAGFEANKIGGNVHFGELDKLAKKFGFSAGRDPYLDEYQLAPLREVKDRRNDLAHGTLAFLTCGANVTIDQILAIKNAVIQYLDSLLSNIENYLSVKGYLAPATPT